MIKNNTYNIFADLGLPNPEERLAKAELARQINNLIEKKRLNQTAAAKLLEIDQPKVSALSKGKLAGFSLERLFKFLNILDQEIVIKIVPKKKSKKSAGFSVSESLINRKNIIRHQNTATSSSISIQAKKKAAK